MLHKRTRKSDMGATENHGPIGAIRHIPSPAPAPAPTKQDYIHASIVSALLALMDGLDSRGQDLLPPQSLLPARLNPAAPLVHSPSRACGCRDPGAAGLSSV